jgi:DNA-binding MarR family transcriptional regulator
VSDLGSEPIGSQRDLGEPIGSERDLGSAGADPTDRVTAAIAVLFRLEGSRRLHRQQAEAAGVALSQQGLRVLGRLIDQGPATPGQLAGLLELDPAVITRLLRQLEDGGLARRQRSAEDGRVSTAHATDAGRDAFNRMRDVIWRHMRAVLDEWAAGDIEELAALLERLVTDVQRVPYAQVAEPAVSARSHRSA